MKLKYIIMNWINFPQPTSDTIGTIYKLNAKGL